MSAVENPGEFSYAVFRRTLKYHRVAPSSIIQKDLATLAKYDAEAESQQKSWNIVLSVSGLLAVVLVFLTIAAFQGGPVTGIPVLIVLLGDVGMVIYSAIQSYTYRRLNLENRRYLIVGQILPFLERDVEPNAPFEIMIDFNDYHQRVYRKEASGQQSSYEVSWFSLKGRFVDGNRFRLAVTLCVKRKEKPKRKYTKVRERFCEFVELNLQVRANRYPGVAGMVQAVPPYGGPTGALPINVRVTGNVVRLSGTTSSYMRITGRHQTLDQSNDRSLATRETLLHLFISAYAGLARCQRKTA